MSGGPSRCLGSVTTVAARRRHLPPRHERTRGLGGHGFDSIGANAHLQGTRPGCLPEVREQDAFHGYIKSSRSWSRS
jgi:hypothetical protein